uniref:Uncharacterized protein n=1 Tax=Amphimedon queenslandica TaxID=400682 RepID=A0A1X7VMG3_AMPQE
SPSLPPPSLSLLLLTEVSSFAGTTSTVSPDWT